MSSTAFDPRVRRIGRTAQLAGAVLFIGGLPLLLGLNDGSVPLALTGMSLAIVGVLAFFGGSVAAAPDHLEKAPLTDEQRQQRNSDLLVLVGALMAVVFPVGGFIAGAVLLGRRAIWGALLMIASALSATFWFNHYFA